MKKILFILLPVLLCMASCRKDTEGIGGNAVEKEVELEIYAPSLATRAEIPEEDAIKRLDILVFQENGSARTFLYRRYAWKTANGANTYRTTLKVGTNLTVYFVANAKTILDNVPGGLLEDGSGASWESIEKELIMSRPDELNYDDGLPMWGMLEGRTIEEKPVNNLGPVWLLRSVASADFELTASDFELEAVYLVFASDIGYLSYDRSNVIIDSEGRVTAKEPYVPSGMVTDREWKYDLTGGAKTVNNFFYMFDNDAGMPSAHVDRRQSKLVMAGKWTGTGAIGRTTYYPLGFREMVGEDATRLKVTRNYKYQVTVTGVNGDGFDSLEDAKDGEEINVDYDVVPWEDLDDEEIIVEGNMYVSLNRKYATLWQGRNTRDYIPFSTNYEISDIRMSASKNVEGDPGFFGQEIFLFSDPTADEPTPVQFCRVTLDEDPLDEDRPRFIFSAWQDITGILNKDYYRSAKLYVRIGRITFEIQVRQYNMNENDWGDGGNIDWPPQKG